MARVLILGANGQLARNTTGVLLEKTDADSRRAAARVSQAARFRTR